MSYKPIYLLSAQQHTHSPAHTHTVLEHTHRSQADALLRGRHQRAEQAQGINRKQSATPVNGIQNLNFEGNLGICTISLFSLFINLHVSFHHSVLLSPYDDSILLQYFSATPAPVYMHSSLPLSLSLSQPNLSRPLAAHPEAGYFGGFYP